MIVLRLAQYTEKRFAEHHKNEIVRVLRKAYKTLHAEPSFSGMKFLFIAAKHIKVADCIEAAFAVSMDS